MNKLIKALHALVFESKVSSNVLWLVGDRAVRLIVGVVVTAAIARSMAPSEFGELSFLLVIFSLIVSFSSYGLQGVVVRDIIEKSDFKSTVSAAFTIQIGLSAVCVLLVVSGVFLLIIDTNNLAALLLLLLSSPFASFQSIRYVFEAHVNAKTVIVADSIAFLVGAFLKIGAVLLSGTLLSVALAYAMEQVLSATLILIVSAYKLKWIPKLSFTREDTLRLLREAAPFALSGFTVLAFMRTDQIMVQHLLGTEALGYYSASVRLSEAWLFVPLAIITSAYPRILEAQQDSVLLEKRTLLLYRASVGICIVFSLLVLLFSSQLISLIFGKTYEAASGLLVFHVWLSVLVVINVISGRWLISEQLGKIALRRSLLALLLNVAGNWLLIPIFGMYGAILSTFIAYLFSAYLIDMVDPKTRPLFLIKTRALLFVTLKG